MEKVNQYTINLLSKAVEDGRSRNYKAAVKKLKKILGMTDALPEALLYLGRAAHELGEFEEAVMAFRMFITRFPKSSAGYFYLGRTHLASGRFSRAASCFLESVKLKPGFAPALAYLGYALMRSGSTADAVEYLKQAVELEPENNKIYTMYINSIFVFSLGEFRNENYGSALNGLLFLESAGYISISTKLYIGIILKEQKNFAEASSYIQEASEMSPDDELIKNILAELYIRQSRIDDALNLLTTYKNKDEVNEYISSVDNAENNFAVSFWNKNDYRAAFHFAIASLKKKRSPEMHLLAGECLKNSGRWDDAYNHYSRASEFDRRAVEPHYGKAVICWLRNDFKGMLEILDKIQSIDENDDFAQYYRLLCSSRLGFPYSQWRDKLNQMLKINEDPWLLTAKGSGCLSEKDNKTAVQAFRKAIKLQDSLKQAWDGLLTALKDDSKQLMQALKKYLGIFKDDLENRRIYADLLLKSEQYPAASAELRKIMSSAEADIGLLKKLAYSCRKSGSYSEAILIYRQILTNDPYNENYLKMLLYCMRMDGRDKETIPLLERAVAAFKKPSVDLLLVYGVTLYRNGMDEQALNVFQKCVYNGINDWRVYRNMGIIYRQKGIGEWAEMYLKKAEKLKKKIKIIAK